MKEHRKHPPYPGYSGENNGQPCLDRHGNVRVSLREKEKRKNLLTRKPEWDSHGGAGSGASSKLDEREAIKRFKAREKERERNRREEERIRLIETSRDRRTEAVVEKEKLRQRAIERYRLSRIKRVHEINRELTPVHSPVRSPKSCSSRSQGEIWAQTPSESPPRSKLRSIVRSLPRSPPLHQPVKSPLPNEPKLKEIFDDSVKPILSAPCDSVESLEGENCEIKSDQKILPAEDMSPISNSSSLGEIDVNEPNPRTEKLAFPEIVSKETTTSRQSEDIVSDENFSDWTEDEDELLNKSSNKNSPIEPMEIPVEEPLVKPSSIASEKPLLKEIEPSPSAEPSPSMKPETADSGSIESQDACSSLQDDALESISDDECDAIIGSTEATDQQTANEEISTSMQILEQESLDDLDIDWSNLIPQPKPQASDSKIHSARLRMSPANILARIGFSHQHAGPKITEKLINYCSNELKENFLPFRHPVADLHCFIGEQLSMRENLFKSSHFFSSALSARTDLDLRKILASTFVNFSHLSSTSVTSSSSPSVSQSQTESPLQSPKQITSSTSIPIETSTPEPVQPIISSN